MGLFFTYFESYILVFGLTMFDQFLSNNSVDTINGTGIGFNIPFIGGNFLNQIFNLIFNSIQMKLSMIPLNVISNWFDEIIADSNSGSKMLHFFNFVENDLESEGWIYKLIGGKDHPPIWLRRLFLIFSNSFKINLIDLILIFFFFFFLKKNFISISKIIFIFSIILWFSRFELYQWYFQFPLILLIDYYLRIVF